MTVHLPDEDRLSELVKLMPSPDVAVRWQQYVQRHLPKFKHLLGELPVPSGPGSMSIAEAFWLYRLVAELQPSAIIDSGSATGWSAWIMAAGASSARILCFDPYQPPDCLPNQAEFFRSDWTKLAGELGPDTFALFDDHVNQRRRVLQAQRSGLVNVVFHDVYRQLTKSTVSLAFTDLVGRAELIHTFEPLWHVDSIFCDTISNSQMYRYLTWLQLSPHPGLGMRARWVAASQRRAIRNPAADQRSRLNWRARG
ncbi:hypothetical protein [Amycolatopsis sp. NBC_00438]|uniref:hypothetical protein n=1 Tax=Amycolatopsis sp. NBC_00438 TaxID=2903558 RepID=UPI002E22A56A